MDQFTSNLKIEYIHYNFKKNEVDPFFNINSENLSKCSLALIAIGKLLFEIFLIIVEITA